MKTMETWSCCVVAGSSWCTLYRLLSRISVLMYANIDGNVYRCSWLILRRVRQREKCFIYRRCQLRMLYRAGGGWRKLMNGALVEWHWVGKTEVLWEKHVQIPHSAPQIAHKLAWGRKQPSSKAVTAFSKDESYAGLLCCYVISVTRNLITLSELKTDLSLNYIRLCKSHFLHSIKLSNI